jgi:hypothetical protein
VTPDKRAGLREAIANDPGTMSWPSKTITDLLDDIDAAERDLNDWRNAAYAEAQGGKARAELAEAEVARLRQEIADVCGERTAEAIRADIAEAQRDDALATITAVRALATEWSGEPTTIDRFLANAILTIVRPGTETHDDA